jgi:predicted transcriptional regulator
MSVETLINPRQIRKDLHLSRERMGRLLDVSAKMVERMDAGPRLPTGSRVRSQLAAIQQIIDLGLRVYTREGFAQFLITPLPEFAGRTALQMIEQGHASEVRSALAADYEGIGF